MAGRIKRPEASARLPLPRVGRVKVGLKSDKGYPQSVDYFIPQGKYAALFTEVYGEKPNIIQVIFPVGDCEKVCSERFEYRDNDGKLFAFGDGETFEVWNQTNKRYETLSITDYPNLMDSVAKRCPTKRSQRGDGWEVTLTLRFMLPKVGSVFGVWEFTTKGGASSIPQIRDSFDSMGNFNGTAEGVIFDLSVEFAKSGKPGEKSRFPVVSLVANHSQQNIDDIKASSSSFATNKLLQ